jgi:hypothetical protein
MIGGIGFAMMVWDLAKRQTSWLRLDRLPMSREQQREWWSVDYAYYGICADAEQKWEANRGPRADGICATVFL